MRLGRPKAADARPKSTGGGGKHRQAAAPPSIAPAEDEPDLELEAYLAALAPTPTDPSNTDPGKRFGTAQVHQLRLPAEADERLRGLAAERGTSPLSLIQDWVLQRLEWELRGRRR
jgi:hypothetical protein